MLQALRAIEEVLGTVYSPAYYSDNDFYNQEALLVMGGRVLLEMVDMQIPRPTGRTAI